MFNDAEIYKNFYEIIGGKKFFRSPSNPYHSVTLGGISAQIDMYLHKNKLSYVFIHGLNVYLSEENIFQPDVIVLTAKNSKLIDWDRGIFGAPDMVVEVLSRSTRKIDLTIKKDSYEACGVKEYWIVDPYMQVVDVYLLRDGKYFLDDEYINYTPEEFQELADEQKAAAKSEIKLSIFEDCVVKLEDIFCYD